MHRARVELGRHPRGLHEITGHVARVVAASGVEDGLCHVWLHHTSASLVVNENADPDVLRDLEAWMLRQVPDGDPRYLHDEEGPDDMPAHIRAALTQPSLTLPVEDGRLLLGTWQGVFLWEHRTHAHARRLTVTVW